MYHNVIAPAPNHPAINVAAVAMINAVPGAPVPAPPAMINNVINGVQQPPPINIPPRVAEPRPEDQPE